MSSVVSLQAMSLPHSKRGQYTERKSIGGTESNKKERNTANIVFQCKHPIYHLFFGSVRKMSECFANQQTNMSLIE
jgi:hypothetical protein